MADGQVYFYLPKAAEAFFKEIDQAQLKFDQYYVCFLMGVLRGKLGSPNDLAENYFQDSYPAAYRAKRGVIAGLLIEAEIRRLDIQPGDRTRVQQLILRLTSTNDTFLSDEGASQMNLYAAGGMSIIRERIIPPQNLTDFLLFYHETLRQVEAELAGREGPLAI